MVNGKPPELEDKTMSEQGPEERIARAHEEIMFIRRALKEFAVANEDPFLEHLADGLIDAMDEIFDLLKKAVGEDDTESTEDPEDDQPLGSGPPHSEAEH